MIPAITRNEILFRRIPSVSDVGNRAAAWVDLPRVPFDLRMTLSSGQVFHWEVETEICQGLVDRELLTLRLHRGRWQVPRHLEKLALRYFSLDHPLAEIYATFPKDAFSQAALRACVGLRIIRQPKWECLATFITSPMKQVPHIQKISLLLRKRYGDPAAERGCCAVGVGGVLSRYGILSVGRNAYPSPEVLSSLREEDLRACGLGFRAQGLLGAARAVAEGSIDLEALEGMETACAREVLMELPGVGEKIANCVLLFAYERLEAVPVDVWIGRILHQMRRGRRATPLQLERYSRRRFGPYAGYVQQALFHYARTSRTLPHSE